MEGVKSMTDREILDYIKSDKQKGMAFLIDAYSSLVFKIVSSVVLPVGSVQDAEECVSDVFIVFYNNIEKIDLQKSSLKGFLAMLAKRNAITLYRSLKRTYLSEENYEDQTDLPFVENGLDADTRKALFDAVKALGEPDCTIVTRRYILGQTAAEIAPTVNLSSAAVQKRIERSILKLREMLGGVVNG